jgi:P27 family predicted phage terminase small subunit
MPGPPPTPNVIKLLRGNPGKRPIRPKPEPAIPNDMPEPPPFLGAYALDEWWGTGVELHRIGLLTAVDVQPFAAYCQAYHHFRTATEKLKQMADADPVMAGLLVKSGKGTAVQNPLVLTARQAANDMVTYASHFGLTPAARARIACAGFDPPRGPGKFDGLLRG